MIVPHVVTGALRREHTAQRIGVGELVLRKSGSGEKKQKNSSREELILQKERHGANGF
jgi:hypothetical protein